MRAPARCQACGELIAGGDTHERWDGGRSFFRFCPVCAEEWDRTTDPSEYYDTARDPITGEWAPVDRLPG